MIFLPHMACPAAAEAMAMREGLSLAIRLSCGNVIMVSDSIETIEACTGEEAWSVVGRILGNIQDSVDLASLIDSVSFNQRSK
jgi:hypothetical protein